MNTRDIPYSSGIYRITCTATGKAYIGSAVILRQRIYVHLSALRRNAHINPKLQHAFNKYGEESFACEVLELVLPAFLIEREQYWLDKLKPFGKKGYNIARSAGSRMGIKHSLEVRKKMGLAHLGVKQSEETVRKRMLTGIGHPHGVEERIKNREAKQAYMKSLIVIAPDGAEYTIVGIRKFCKEHGLHRGHLIEVAQGKISQHKGWKARFPD